MKFREWLKTNQINEAKFSASAINNPKHNYCKDVIKKLLAGEEVKLGAEGKSGVVTIKDYNVDSLNILLKLPVSQITVQDFNNCSLSSKGIWTNIFKGDFSGYSNGAASGNKGNAFESELTNEIQAYIDGEDPTPNVIKLLKLVDGDIVAVKADGALKQARPLVFDGSTIKCGKSETADIGKTVSDITITVKNKNKKEQEYLSLKYGGTVTFVNAGVTKYLPASEIVDGEIKNKEGIALLKLLGIDNKKFCEIFTSYSDTNESVEISIEDECWINEAKASTKAIEDVTAKIQRNKNFKTFLKSVIGYGYILIHKIGSETHFFDMRDESTLDSVCKVKRVAVYYPQNSEAKRVDVYVELNGINLKFNIRNKQGGVFPTHLMSDYKIIDGILPTI